MAYREKPNSPFLFDSETDRIVGIKNSDGSETILTSFDALALKPISRILLSYQSVSPKRRLSMRSPLRGFSRRAELIRKMPKLLPSIRRSTLSEQP